MRNLIFALLLSACGAPAYVAPEMLNHLAAFEGEAQIRRVYVNTRDTEIDFSTELPHWIIAECKDGKIHFNLTYWYVYSDSDRESVLFQELANCVLHKNIKTQYQLGSIYLSRRASIIDAILLR